MDPDQAFPCYSTIETHAPVNGGMRWRTRDHDALWCIRRNGGAGVRDFDEPAEKSPFTDVPEIRAAPVLTAQPPEEARVGTEYVFQARAHADYVDGFTWYLEEAAPGMSVDRHTGLVTWLPPEGGHIRVVLCARSLYGAEARQSWTILVRKPAPSRTAVANPRFRLALSRKAAKNAGQLWFFLIWRRKMRWLVVRVAATAPPPPPSSVAMPLRI